MVETILISAIALVFVFEGLLPFIFPKFWKKIMKQAAEQDEKNLRIMGLVSISIGLIILLLLS
ncbi:MAG TPA: DUF2065 domain-containing protein [Thiomicrospira sp.]|jgi:uncharacterized protein YjeT (DUF2065 family)|nr:DUF2065 domain-containing protein [Thiomicrospira sp.]